MNAKQMRYCGHCGHSWTGARGRVHCTHPIDETLIAADSLDGNPIWAIRKYASLGTIMKLRTGDRNPGSDPENMRFDDGADCRVWKPRDE